MLSLSDDELSVLMNLAAPIDVTMRDAFLRACAQELERYLPDAIGVGLINRVARQMQREFMRSSSLRHEPRI